MGFSVRLGIVDQVLGMHTIPSVTLAYRYTYFYVHIIYRIAIETAKWCPCTCTCDSIHIYEPVQLMSCWGPAMECPV